MGPIARESQEHSEDHGARGSVVIIRWSLAELPGVLGVTLPAALRPAPPDLVLELLEEMW